MAQAHQPDDSWRPYVVQHHTGFGPDHYDLMLQQGNAALEALWTWQLDRPPGPDPAPIVARRIVDHRLAYLTYEGPISGGRGRCRIVDRGRFHVLINSDELIRLELAGENANGVYDLVLTDRERNVWQLIGSKA